MSKEIFLCAINNILSGTCAEDCSFCTQSVRYHADIERYNYKPIEQIVKEAKLAKEIGTLGYCLVTSGKGLNDKKTEYIATAAKAIKKEIDSIHLIGCNGIANIEQLRYLKDSGIDSYNHNLETSSSYYQQICTTHSWEERYETCLNAKSVGLSLCTGGIFGMGESNEDRIELMRAILSLEPDAVPLNFYHPNPALPIKSRDITFDEAVNVISKMHKGLGDNKILMIAGGRELLFGGNEKVMFDAGANAIVIGDYLTTYGDAPQSDIEMLNKLGLKIAINCPGHN
ncbi:MAG: biotin synthase [Sulfurovaceae bacterium]|nr:biotin synthase [Sulfurovaceae bacterium]